MNQAKLKQLQATLATLVIMTLVIAPMLLIGIDALWKTLKG